ncbi:hypothetical protein AB0M52_30230, partial [Micromonospora sp. NPDC051296]
EFLALNPDFKYIDNGFAPDGIVVSYGNFSAAREVWRWILGDASARAWLAGQPDGLSGPDGGPGMRVNENYKFVTTDGAQDYFPRTDPSCLPPLHSPLLEDWQQEVDPGRCTLDLFPYASSIGEAAYQTLRADTKQLSGWQPSFDPAIPGRYGKEPPKQVGQRFALSITDSASAARYGLHTAQLCTAVSDAEGKLTANDCRAATTSGMLTAANAMVPSGVTGVRVIDPARVARLPGAYPLTMVTYAAADLTEDATARRDYAALLRYATGSGQAPGHLPGQLPAGYAPLPQFLRVEALQAADKLERYVAPSPTPEPTSQPTPQPSATNTTAPPAPSTNPEPTPSTVPNPGVGPTPSPTPSTAPQPSADRPVAQVAPGSPIGPIRYLLVALLVVGLAGGAVGPVLLLVSRRLGANNGGST